MISTRRTPEQESVEDSDHTRPTLASTPLVREEQSEPEISVAEQLRPTVEEVEDRGLDGESFGKYLIVGEVAVGGMAEVFLAVQRGLEGFVKVLVIKRVLPQYGSSPEFVRMFIDEARLAARLEHPNIVRTYEFGEEAGQYFTTMEYLAGEDLCKTLNKLAASRQEMPVHVAAGIVSQVCAGLQFAHQLTDTAGRPLHLIHRDINPANIILTYGGEVKIIDFGVAKTTENAQTVAGTIKGKIAYMAPEQLLARGIDQRSDIFSTGVVLWELLTGRPLFIRDSEAATLYAIMNDPIRPPSRHRPEVPRALDDIVMRALSRTPADRYDTAEEMQSALEQFLASQPKYDARTLGRVLEEAFGEARATAKRSIAQTRSLGRNISLVMKLRSEIRTDLADKLDSLTANERVRPATLPLAPESNGMSRAIMALCALLLLGGIAGGVLFMLNGDDSNKEASAQTLSHASLQIESTPPGAAISIGGEPTGLKTPATLTGISAAQVTVRLELADYATKSETISVPAGQKVTRHIVLAGSGRLLLAGLPAGASVFIGSEEYAGGEAIDVQAGTHELRVVVNGRTIAQQQIETTTGDQQWKLVGDRLFRSDPRIAN